MTKMEGLAEWLRKQDVPGYSGPYYENLRRWASEVEAAASPEGEVAWRPAMKLLEDWMIGQSGPLVGVAFDQDDAAKLVAAASVVSRKAETKQLFAESLYANPPVQEPPSEDDLIAAAEKYADNYEGDDIPARDVRASIQNAFFAGSKWRLKKASEERDALNELVEAHDEFDAVMGDYSTPAWNAAGTRLKAAWDRARSLVARNGADTEKAGPDEKETGLGVELARQALEALELHTDLTRQIRNTDAAITALRKALGEKP